MDGPQLQQTIWAICNTIGQMTRCTYKSWSDVTGRLNPEAGTPIPLEKQYAVWSALTRRTTYCGVPIQIHHHTSAQKRTSPLLNVFRDRHESLKVPLLLDSNSGKSNGLPTHTKGVASFLKYFRHPDGGSSSVEAHFCNQSPRCTLNKR